MSDSDLSRQQQSYMEEEIKQARDKGKTWKEIGEMFHLPDKMVSLLARRDKQEKSISKS